MPLLNSWNKESAFVYSECTARGTSALTRLISLAGAQLPSQVMGASAGNALGHWEPHRLVTYHDRFLSEYDSSWSDWRPFDVERMSDEAIAAYNREIADIVAADYGDAPLFVLKDPRVCRFF